VGSVSPPGDSGCASRAASAALHRLHAERLDAVEDPLAGAEQNRRDVERELVDGPGYERLAHGRGAAGDVDAAVAGGLARSRVGGVEPVGDEMERRAALHLDRPR
jgi:hypothetical protein